MREAVLSFMGPGSPREIRPEEDADHGAKSAAKVPGNGWRVACAAPSVVIPLTLGVAAGLGPVRSVSLALVGGGLHAACAAVVKVRAARCGTSLATRASTVTSLRLAIVAGLAALAIDPRSFSPWPVVVAAVASLILDGFDGRFARRDGNASTLGAWFDQETDALFVLVLGVLLWRLDLAGAWVMAAGAWRYAFLAAVALVPRLRGDLAFSQRRRIVCVVLLTCLVVCLSPLFAIAASLGLAAETVDALRRGLAAFAVLLVSASFTIDLVGQWTMNSPQRPRPLNP